MNSLSRVLERLDKVRGSGRTYKACCPTHSDKNPSLSIGYVEGKVVLHCHAGCSPEGIVKAIGLEMRDLFDDSEERIETGCRLSDMSRRLGITEALLKSYGLRDAKGHGDIPVVELPFFDEKSRVLRTKKRTKTEGSSKYVYAKDGKGSHVYGLWQPVPIRGEVVITEGETDAICLWSVGVPALGIPGATNTNVLQRRHLRGVQTAWIAGDNDEAGVKFQRDMAEKLEQWEIEARALNAPEPYNDLAAWKCACGASWRTELLEAKKSSPSTIDDGTILASEVEAKEICFAFRPYIPRGYLTILAGHPGTGKSLTTCALAAAVSHGKEIMGLSTTRGNSLIFSAEDDRGAVIRPRLERCGADLDAVRLFKFDEEDLVLDESGTERIEKLISRHDPALIVLDPLSVFMSDGVDMNKANEVRSRLKPLAMIAMRRNVAILVVAHSPKNAKSAIHNVLGSTDFVAAVRSGLLAHKDPDYSKEQGHYVLSHFKHNLSAGGPTLKYQIKPAFDNPDLPSFAWAGISPYSADEIMRISDEDQKQIDEAAQFLQAEIVGRREVTQIMNRARGVGISHGALRMAIAREGISRSSTGFGDSTTWYFEYPVDDKQQEPS